MGQVGTYLPGSGGCAWWCEVYDWDEGSLRLLSRVGSAPFLSFGAFLSRVGFSGRAPPLSSLSKLLPSFPIWWSPVADWTCWRRVNGRLCGTVRVSANHAKTGILYQCGADIVFKDGQKILIFFLNFKNKCRILMDRCLAILTFLSSMSICYRMREPHWLSNV